MFHSWCFFVQRPISEDPRPITTKLCHVIGIWLYFIMHVQNFRERPTPQKKKYWGQKTCKISADFLQHPIWIWLRISPERLKMSKPKRDVFQIDSSCVLGNKSRELWSTNFRDFDVRFDPLKCTFWGYYISALRGCCALKLLHALEIDQGYLVHTPTGTGVPPKKFNREN